MAVLADMKELGERTREFHEEVGEFLAEQPVDLLITYGSLAESIAVGAKKRAAADGAGDRAPLTIVVFAESEKEKMTE